MTVRQYEMVNRILNDYRNRLTEKEALELNQLIFGSLCRHVWVDYEPKGEYFYVTDDGKEVRRTLHEWNPFRVTNLNVYSKFAEMLRSSFRSRRRRTVEVIHRKAS